MNKILFVVTNNNKIGTGDHDAGYEFSEVADPYFEFTNKSYQVDFASLLWGKTPEYAYDTNHKNSFNFRNSPSFTELNMSHILSEIDITDYDAVFFPGGLWPMVDMLNDPVIKNTIRKFYKANKIVWAVCHWPVALLNIKMQDGSNFLDGKKITSFTQAEEDAAGHPLNEMIPFMLDKELKNQGALFSNAGIFESNTVVDWNLVTGQNPASASWVAEEMIQLLK